MLEEVSQEIEHKMERSLEALHKELSRIRTGRASLALLDGIIVAYYGTPTPLNQLATLAVPESRMITICVGRPTQRSGITRQDMSVAVNTSLSPISDASVTMRGL